MITTLVTFGTVAAMSANPSGDRNSMRAFSDTMTIQGPAFWEDEDETSAILADEDCMQAFRRGAEQLAAGQSVSLEDLEKELGL